MASGVRASEECIEAFNNFKLGTIYLFKYIYLQIYLNNIYFDIKEKKKPT
jgi:hypothetical protein